MVGHSTHPVQGARLDPLGSGELRSQVPRDTTQKQKPREVTEEEMLQGSVLKYQHLYARKINTTTNKKDKGTILIIKKMQNKPTIQIYLF